MHPTLVIVCPTPVMVCPTLVVACLAHANGDVGTPEGLCEYVLMPWQSIWFSYRDTSMIKNSPPTQEHHRALGVVLREGPRGGAVSTERGTPVPSFLVIPLK